MYSMNELKKYCYKCHKCRLSETRTNVVFGEGNEQADIMFVGEGPGYNEDIQGRPFVGKAGQLLDKMIEAINLKRDDVYIANVVKCRPPENRNPFDDESSVCLEFLRWQVKLVNPKIIVCLGAVSAKNLINPDLKISRERGKFVKKGKIYFIPTYHPSYLLRNEAAKKDAWEDFKSIDAKLKELTESF
ncbi:MULTISPECIES: uracil-DNA glycosylase [unclassified Sedimentibacter]|uniref:uracil-DNA glycosylase n=1 Tax=unclassified Sedimentibacter TaxID=2649220 RepID=UPI0027E1B19C|nr:uracil-DNA glycosylase [Sedimentibacter sp. MB35-C1]WMJ78216.1 uracil-DNA glycosylase [Sedimentibacter sp. MB35-C1]